MFGLGAVSGSRTFGAWEGDLALKDNMSMWMHSPARIPKTPEGGGVEGRAYNSEGP